MLASLPASRFYINFVYWQKIVRHVTAVFSQEWERLQVYFWITSQSVCEKIISGLYNWSWSPYTWDGTITQLIDEHKAFGHSKAKQKIQTNHHTKKKTQTIAHAVLVNSVFYFVFILLACSTNLMLPKTTSSVLCWSAHPHHVFLLPLFMSCRAHFNSPPVYQAFKSNQKVSHNTNRMFSLLPLTASLFSQPAQVSHSCILCCCTQVMQEELKGY